jgi:hypothetical protein
MPEEDQTLNAAVKVAPDTHEALSEADNTGGSALPAEPARGSPGSRSPKQSEDQSPERLLAGVISRIERLENWIKTNRLG